MLGKDYTRFPAGTQTTDGLIQKCPMCGRSGVIEETDEKKWCLHKQSTMFNDRAEAAPKWEMCLVQDKSPS
jgi:hypothetical protein